MVLANKIKINFVSDFLVYDLLEIYFLMLLNSVFFKFVSGFIVKRKKIIIFLESLFLHFFVFFFKNSSFLQTTSLMDICVSDFPKRVVNRFELSYTF
jgi:hypothetical protein